MEILDLARVDVPLVALVMGDSRPRVRDVARITIEERLAARNDDSCECCRYEIPPLEALDLALTEHALLVLPRLHRLASGSGEWSTEARAAYTEIAGHAPPYDEARFLRSAR